MATKQAPRKNYSLDGIGTDADPFKVASGGIRTNELETIGTITPDEYTNPTLTVDSKGRIVEIADGSAPSPGDGADTTSEVLLVATSATGATLDLEYLGEIAPVNADFVQTTVPGTFTLTVPAGVRLRTGCFIGNSNHVTAGSQITFKFVDTDGRSIHFIPTLLFLDGSTWKQVDLQANGHNPSQDDQVAGTITSTWLNMGYDDFMILFQFVNRKLP